MKNNRIAFNVNNGVGIEPGSTGIRISRNSIFSNGILGIDLEFDDTVNQNDLGDVDSGTDNLQSFPVLTHALVTPVRLIVRGTIDTPSPRTVTIEFFATELSVDPSGHGEGAVYLGRVRPNSEGGFIASLRRVNPGTLITATAADANGNTSEFQRISKQQVPFISDRWFIQDYNCSWQYQE